MSDLVPDVRELDLSGLDLDGLDLDALDLHAPELRAHPYELYRRLREGAPIVPTPFEEDTFVLTSFADGEAVLRDPRWSSNPAHRPVGDGPTDVRTEMSRAGSQVLLFIDPPDHTRLRKLVSKAFTPRTVERLRPRVQQLVDDLLDAAEAKGELDIVTELGYLLPVNVICEMIGVPTDDVERFGPWSSDASRLLDGILDEETTNLGVLGAMSIVAYLNELIEQRRAEPRDDLLSALIAVEEEGDRLGEEELRSILLLLFIAGHETTMNLIGNGMCALLRHRDQFDRLREDPTLAPSAIDELLRFDGPVHMTVRIATEDLEVNGRRFRRHDQAIVLLAAANRDPARFDRPDELDIGRRDSHHLAFSHGIHYCLGAALARLEGQVAITSLVTRFPDMRLLTDPVEYREHVVLRGLKELRVALA